MNDQGSENFFGQLGKTLESLILVYGKNAALIQLSLKCIGIRNSSCKSYICTLPSGKSHGLGSGVI